MTTSDATRTLGAGLMLVACATLSAQDETRQIWDSGFRQKRPAAADATTRPTTPPNADYRTSDPGPRPGASTTVLGFTMWRLRPAQTNDSAPRLLVQDAGQPTEFVQERLQPAGRLHVNDRIRLGIEVAQDGYLYVIDRERYTDGSRGTPHLIFPARRLRNGDNHIIPGRLIEIPDQRDTVKALRLQRSNERYAGEELLVIVTTRPIEGLPTADREIPLPVTQVAEWERRWGAQTQRLDLASTEGASWTPAEQSAGLAQRLLTQEDPLPSSLFRVPSNGDGLAVIIPLLVE